MSTYTRPPAPPQGFSPEAIWMRQMLKYVESTMLRSVRGAKTIPDARGGYHLVIAKQNPGGAKGSGSSLQAFTLVSDGGDWYNCTPAVGSGIVKIGKEDSLRCILPTASPAGGAWTARTERGTNYTFFYASIGGATTDGVNVIEYTREKKGSVAGPGPNGGFVEFVTPCLNVGDTLFAMPWSFTAPATLVGVTLLALPGKYEFSTVLEDLDSSAL